MQLRAIFLVVCLTLSTGWAEDELTPIFNGKDFTGWKVPATNPWWTIEEGAMVGRQDGDARGNVLETEKSYRDVIIETEVRWFGNIDSGIFVRKGQQWQCQLGTSVSLRRDMTCSIYVPKGGYVIQAKNTDKLLKVGEWNKVRIEMRGDHYKISLNGEVVVDADLPGYNEPGPVGLQIHAGVKSMKVEFRNLTAKALD